MKRFLPLILFMILFFIFTPSVYAGKASIVLINQIRGMEACCEPGTSDLWETVTNSSRFKDIPIGWALRYDAIATFPQIAQVGELGILLEVTPGLAVASNVSYSGSPDGRDWYMAEHSFLVGYTISERKKLIDTLFFKFKERFGYYPSFTSGWMIDAWSLSYIRNTYNVVFHELTKEQYETDSYTLYGGIFNFPYFPAKNFPLLPGKEDDKLDIVVARQTVSDLVYNYGSPKTVYTSQPNDYLSDTTGQKGISYFKSLIQDTINQKSPIGFGLVGFENSFDWKKYGTEYMQQLEYLSGLSGRGAIDIYAPGDFAEKFKQQFTSNPSFYLVKDFATGKPFGTLWYFGQTYRARIILKEGNVILDDLRNFMSLSDPYVQDPVNTDYAYWIVPYLIDGSQEYQLLPGQKDRLQKSGLVGNTVSDVYTSPFGIKLGQGKFETKQLDNSVQIIFADGKGSVKLLPNEISFSNSPGFNFTKPVDKNFGILFDGKNTEYSFDHQFKFSIQKEGNGLKLGWQRGSLFAGLFSLEKQDNGFSLHAEEEKDIAFLDPMFQPDKSDLPIDPQKSVFYWNNTTAVAGRNPLRLFILPLNTIGMPSKVTDVKFDSEKKADLKIVYPQDYTFRVSPWFVDITAEKPLKSTLNVTVDGTVIAHNIPIEFITDCRSHISICARNPGQLVGYIMYMIKEQSGMISEKLRTSH